MQSSNSNSPLSSLEPGPKSNLPKRKFEYQSESKPAPFNKFFLDWLQVQERDLEELKSMVKTHSESTRQLQELVDRVMTHYDEFYRARSESIKENVLLVLNPDWLSKLEDAFLWLGGWRPTTAVHLLYSKAGLQFEARLSELLSGVNSDDLSNLSPSQLVRVDELQRQTIHQERKLTEILASHQETMADSSMVELSENYTELKRDAESAARKSDRVDSVKDRVDSALAPKEHGLEDILRKADDLRLKTLKSVVDILTPIQAVHFLIADTQLHLRVHEWGKLKDEDAKSSKEARGFVGPGGPQPSP
ncbi:protein DOG1-like 3 [Chenopodium quinoa]|uniref:DOG1 domain-containing protein n=1 Tax=Chenopodium quinoa TaxID=63459 RepID=A0A803L4V9_CHEQI|nr:protein DOG1-like 3 [Chenopodium quinoa]